MFNKSTYPKNDENTLYLDGGWSWPLSELIEKITEHFGQIALDKLDIRAEHIHTRCLTYDLYDSGDWDTYIVITRK
jgi:hypothetical protein